MPASMRTSSPVPPHRRLHAAPDCATPVADRPVEDRQVRAAARRVEVGERGVEPDARLDVDRLDPEADAAVEVVEVVRPRNTERPAASRQARWNGPTSSSA